MTDSEVKNIIFKGKSLRKSRNFTDIYENDLELLNFLSTRYSDSESLNETLFRLKNDIEIRPACKCGNKLKFTGDIRRGGYTDYCSEECRNKYMIINLQESYFSRTGYKCSLQNPDVREKIKLTCLIKYGVANGGASELALEKIKSTTVKHYGVSCSFQSEEVKRKIAATSLERYGVTNGGGSKLAQLKIRKTLHTNNSFNKSKEEDYVFELLTKKFSNVFRQYYSDEYPFKCDFYIKDINTYIEYQGYFTHNKHPFTGSVEDKRKLEYYKQKSLEHPLYQALIYTWTVKDVEKRNTANKNGLNYIEIWNIKEAEKVIEQINI